MKRERTFRFLASTLVTDWGRGGLERNEAFIFEQTDLKETV